MHHILGVVHHNSTIVYIHYKFRSQCIKTLGIIIWDGKGGKQGVLHGVQSNPNNFLADILHFWEGGSTQFGNFPKIHGICSVLSSYYHTRSIIQYLWEILKSFTDNQKHFCKLFPPSSIDEHFSSQTWYYQVKVKVKVGIR